MLDTAALSRPASVNPYQYRLPAPGAAAVSLSRADVAPVAPAENGAASTKTSRLAAQGIRECETCNSRKYQDGSNDPGVSFKTPTHVSPEQSGAAVRAHEGEHVNREQAKAEQEDREVVSQSVQIRTAVCPECGKSYVSGGTTTTMTREKKRQPDPVRPDGDPGQVIDRYR